MTAPALTNRCPDCGEPEVLRVARVTKRLIALCPKCQPIAVQELEAPSQRDCVRVEWTGSEIVLTTLAGARITCSRAGAERLVARVLAALAGR